MCKKNLLVGSLLLLLCSACVFQTKVPLDTLQYSSPAASKKSQLIILLRGFGNDINYFDSLGWTEKLQQRYPQYDIIIPDLHYGYYSEGSFMQRMTEDIILPAQQQGYQSIWILGISMGGLGAIMSSELNPTIVKRLFLIAPYLGDGTAQKTIVKAGGLRKWDDEDMDSTVWQFKLWSHLKFLSAQSPAVPVYLGYGSEDKMPGIPLLQAALPVKNIVTAAGGHKDGVFTDVFEKMLAAGYFESNVH